MEVLGSSRKLTKDEFLRPMAGDPIVVNIRHKRRTRVVSGVLLETVQSICLDKCFIEARTSWQAPTGMEYRGVTRQKRMAGTSAWTVLGVFLAEAPSSS